MTTTAQPDAPLPLAGITVVSLEQAVAAPLATRQLADWGSRVIKIERPRTGDFARHYDRTVHGMSSYFPWLNRAKESVTLDLKSEIGVDVLSRLLGGADVLVENLAPGAVDRLGFDDATLRSRFPRLIVCHVSGYGRSGPYRGRKAYDLLVQSESGLLSLTGTPAQAVKVGTPVADLAAGMYAFAGILLALRHRDATGQGTIVDVAMLDGLGEWLGHALYFTAYGGSAPPRSGAHHATIAPYGLYTAGDGRGLFLAVQNEREWLRFCADVLEQPSVASDRDFCDNSARVTNRQRLDAVIDDVLRNLTVTELRERLDRAAIAYGNHNGIEDFLEHPQLSARQRWAEIGTPQGPVNALKPPIEIDAVHPVMGDVPALGDHTAAVLRELGYAPEKIADWHERGLT